MATKMLVTDYLTQISVLLAKNVALTKECTELKAEVAALQLENQQLRLKVAPPQKVIAKARPVKKRVVVWDR